MKSLVTGGAGFIGSNLALELERQEHQVTVLDNYFHGSTQQENLRDFKGRIIRGDESILEELSENYNNIFHIAAITDPRHPNESEIYSKNMGGFLRVLAFAQKNNSKLVYASSANIYGNGKTPMHEEQPKEIISQYGRSKLKMDDYSETLFRKMQIIGLRYFNVFGPREKHKGRPASMIYHLGRQMLAGNRPKLFKFGEQTRDHIYVNDVIDATIKALDAKQSCIVNVGTGVATSFNKLAENLNQELGTNLEPEYIDMPYDPKTYQSNTQADTTKAHELIGFKSKFTLEEGIKEYFSWLEKNGW